MVMSVRIKNWLILWASLNQCGMCKCKLQFVVLLLLEIRDVAVVEFVYCSICVCLGIANCVCVCRMLANARLVCECSHISLHLFCVVRLRMYFFCCLIVSCRTGNWISLNWQLEIMNILPKKRYVNYTCIFSRPYLSNGHAIGMVVIHPSLHSCVCG